MKHILYAEDREDDVFFLRRACRRSGLHDAVTIHTVADGESAIDYLRGSREFADRAIHPMPDLVLLDLKMPRRTGLEVLEWLRARPEFTSLPAFLLTSSNQQSDIQRAVALRATGYLTKPTSIAELAQLVTDMGQVLGIGAAPAAPASSAPQR